MKVVICAAGDGSRWRNYLGTRKHLAPIEGTPLLQRTVDQLRAAGITDIVITNHPAHPYTINGARCYPRYTKEATTARKLTWPEWALTDSTDADGKSHDGRTLLMLGDVFYTDETIRIMTTPIEGWHQYGRLRASDATGKPGAEMFGWQFHTRDHHEFIAAIEFIDDARARGVKTHVDWSIYSRMTGHDISTPASEIRDWGRHVEIADDGTDDFDFPDDYERFMFRFLGRSSRRVKEKDFYTPWFAARMADLKLLPKLHRKPWEFCSIAQAYDDRIGHGGDVLGFGVGKEPLPAFFASRGAIVVATDRPDPGVWLERQHARNIDELRVEGICDPEKFRDLVSYEPADMNAIPERYHGRFDMTWSASCFEHLGGIEKGLRFFEEQMKCLRPGGFAVHTTEYCANSNEKTINAENLCMFRQKDLAELTRRLAKNGDRLWPIDLVAGVLPADTDVDRERTRLDPHLILELGGVIFTSVLLIGMRGYDA